MLRKWVPFWVIPLILVFAVGTIWLRLSIVRTTYAIHESEKQVRELRQQREDIELKAAALRSPRRLESLARTKFGLGTPQAEQVIHLGSK